MVFNQFDLYGIVSGFLPVETKILEEVSEGMTVIEERKKYIFYYTICKVLYTFV